VYCRTVLLHNIDTHCHRLCKERGIEVKGINLLSYKQSCIVYSCDLGAYCIYCAGIDVPRGLCKEKGIEVKGINLLSYKQSCIVYSCDLGAYCIYCAGIDVPRLMQEDDLM